MNDELQKRVELRVTELGLNPNSASLSAGLGRDYIRNILDGKSGNPKTGHFLKLSHALRCRLEWLLTGEGPITDEWSSLSSEHRQWLAAQIKNAGRIPLFVLTRDLYRFTLPLSHLHRHG